MTESLASQLRAAMDSLTEETWNQGAYFYAEKGKVCMCAHGAIQRIVNPEVKRRLAGTAVDSLDVASAFDAVDQAEAGETAADAFDAVVEAREPAAHYDDPILAVLAAHSARVAASVAVLVDASPAQVAARASNLADFLKRVEEAAHVRSPIDDAYAAECSVEDQGGDILSIWNDRPTYVRENYIVDDVDYGSTESSYLLGLFGLTASFNDDSATTLDMVKDKYRQAIAFAETHSL